MAWLTIQFTWQSGCSSSFLTVPVKESKKASGSQSQLIKIKISLSKWAPGWTLYLVTILLTLLILQWGLTHVSRVSEWTLAFSAASFPTSRRKKKLKDRITVWFWGKCFSTLDCSSLKWKHSIFYVARHEKDTKQEAPGENQDHNLHLKSLILTVRLFSGHGQHASKLKIWSWRLCKE